VIRVSVAELPDNRDRFELAWPALLQHVNFAESEVVVLPELPASEWFGVTPTFDQSKWDRTVAAHDDLIAGLNGFGQAIIIGSRAVTSGDRRHNVAFVWSKEAGLIDLHPKAILPEEPGFHEQSWYHAGTDDLEVVEVRGIKIGVLLCSELMHIERARHLGNAGANIIGVPRATGDHQRWPIATQMAAIASGAFVLTSNRSGQAQGDPSVIFGGRSMIVDPDGAILAETGRDKSFASASIDLGASQAARKSYPRYLDYGDR
jgi:N-carbamoylputrescine amidase